MNNKKKGGNFKQPVQQQRRSSVTKKPTNSNNLCVSLTIEKAHLKAFVLPNQSAASTFVGTKYGEFDVRTNNFNLCVSTSETVKNEYVKKQNSQTGSRKKPTKAEYRLERQYISIFTDTLTVSHASKPYLGQLKYPTNYATFESLFQNSKTKELITCNDPAISKVLFDGGGGNISGNTASAAAGAVAENIDLPMVSIGIKSRFNSKTNIKQVLVALNFNNLSLHHLFCAQPEHWIFQLIELFTLVDIDVIGYQLPVVLTELHLNLTNSCIMYRPLYLTTRALVAFKSLHWSSNVTAESTHTLLVFNIEDIYLFLTKVDENAATAAARSGGDAAATCIDNASTIMLSALSTQQAQQPAATNLRKDWICVANSDLFELRLLINEEIEKQVSCVCRIYHNRCFMKIEGSFSVF